MIDFLLLKKGDEVKVFDYENEIFDEFVTIFIASSDITDIVYQRSNSEKIYFSGQGYFDN